MPTHEETAQFLREFSTLSPALQARFLDAVRKMVNDMRANQPLRPSLRVKGVQGYPGIFELTWAPNGRATFMFGAERVPGDPHIIWRRIGGHEIFGNP